MQQYPVDPASVPASNRWVRQLWFAGLGTAVTALGGVRLVFRAMAEEGERFASRERPGMEHALTAATDRVKDLGERIGTKAEATVAIGLRRWNVPTRDEVTRLALRLEQLTAKLEAHGIER